MNFQNVSVGQKTAGYVDASGTPSTGLAGALDFVDARLGRFVSELAKRGMLESTLIVISAKHGQAPINPAERRIVNSALVPNIVNGVQPGLLSQTTEDDLAILWLTDHSQTEAVVDALQANRVTLGVETILSAIGSPTGSILWPGIRARPVPSSWCIRVSSTPSRRRPSSPSRAASGTTIPMCRFSSRRRS